MGNTELIDQITLRIRDTYIDQLKQNKQDTLAFFIRDNKLQKVYPESAVYYERGKEQKMKAEGMDRKQLRNFISLVKLALNKKGFDLYYCTININYEVLGDSETDLAVKVLVRNESHFGWR